MGINLMKKIDEAQICLLGNIEGEVEYITPQNWQPDGHIWQPQEMNSLCLIQTHGHLEFPQEKQINLDRPVSYSFFASDLSTSSYQGSDWSSAD